MSLTKVSTGYFNIAGFSIKSLFPQKVLFSCKLIADTVTRLPNWHNRQDIWLANPVYLARLCCRWRNTILCFQEQFSVAGLMSLSFLQTAAIFLLIAQLKTRIALTYLSLTFFNRNWFYQKPFFFCSLSYQAAPLFLPSSAGNAWSAGNLVNVFRISFITSVTTSQWYFPMLNSK